MPKCSNQRISAAIGYMSQMRRALYSTITAKYSTYTVCAMSTVFSSYRGETRSFEYASMGVVISRYDWNNRHHEKFDPRISLRIIGVVVVV